jgi:hypothetical protein
MDIVDMAIYQAVCQQSYFHGNSDFHNSHKLDPLQITAKQIQAKLCLPFKDILVQEIDPWYITKVE